MMENVITAPLKIYSRNPLPEGNVETVVLALMSSAIKTGGSFVDIADGRSGRMRSRK